MFCVVFKENIFLTVGSILIFNFNLWLFLILWALTSEDISSL